MHVRPAHTAIGHDFSIVLADGDGAASIHLQELPGIERRREEAAPLLPFIHVPKKVVLLHDSTEPANNARPCGRAL